MRALPVTLLAAAALGLTPAGAHAADSIQVRHERVTFGHDTSMVTVVTMPRPGGNRVLMPALPGGIVSKGTATVSAVSRQLARHGTAVAINADLFEYATGQPSGLLVIDGIIDNEPQGGRPALQVDGRGRLATSLPRARGTLTLPSRKVVPFEVNVRSPADGAVFYDQGWGPSAPSGASSAFIGRLTSGRLDDRGQTWTAAGQMRVLRTAAGGLPIPADDSPDELFQGYGAAGAALRRLRHGQAVGITYRLGPLAPDATFAIGGGPVLIRDGRVVFSVAQASREFTRGQLVPPDARTAVAQLGDGRVLFYAADKGAGSTGLTIAEVARDLHRRGAVTAMAFDSGGSTSVAMDGRLLNQPSDGVERPVGNQLVYFVGDRGHRQPIAAMTVGARAAGALVPTVTYTTVRPAQIGVSLHDPRGHVYLLGTRRVGTGVHQIRLPADVPRRSGRWEAIVTAVGANIDVQQSVHFRVTRAPVTTPTAAPAPRAGGTDPLLWILLSLGFALSLAAALAVLLVRQIRRR
jgi:hypothetical protein